MPQRQDAFWLVGGRLVDWGEAPDDSDSARRANARRRSGAAGVPASSARTFPPTEIDELRIVSDYLASHPETTQLVLDQAGRRRASPSDLERQLGDLGD